MFDQTFAKGERLIAGMKNPPNNNDLPERSLLYFKKFTKHLNQYQPLGGSIPADADVAAKKFGWDLKRPWYYTNYFLDLGESTEDISTTAFDDVSKTLIVEKSFNDVLEDYFNQQNPPIDRRNLPYHSEIWTYTYGEMMATGQHIKYVMRNSIINEDTTDIMLEARKLLAPDSTDADVVEINRESDNIAERESFIALAGSDNGSSLFRMITDKHNMFGFRQVTKVWLWGRNRGQCDISDFCLPIMVWELEARPMESPSNPGCRRDSGIIC